MKAYQVRLLFHAVLWLSLGLVGYRLYLEFMDEDLTAELPHQVDRLDQQLKDHRHFRMAVVGNINNSIGVFEERMVPKINQAAPNLLVSAGNAVSDGGEDKYRALKRSLAHLKMPWLLTYGEQEDGGFGSLRFQQHFGPFHYSVESHGYQFIVLDSTGRTNWGWQMMWLQRQLQEKAQHRFIFLQQSLFLTGDPDETVTDSPMDHEWRRQLLTILKAHPVDAVFSAGMTQPSIRDWHGTRFVNTGSAGGFVLSKKVGTYHYALVDIDEQGKPQVSLKGVDIGQRGVARWLESFWLFVHSLFYVGYTNFLLVIGALLLLALHLYRKILDSAEYYPDYDLDIEPWRQRQLRVAMFTNNYLPFIGGVPIAIERLRRGLEKLGDAVTLVAPRYRHGSERGQDHQLSILRVPTLLALDKSGDFRIANIFTPRIRRHLSAFKPDIIHLHHPFWLGSIGLWMARRLNIPAIYTYHTRLEHYAHFVPIPGRLFRHLISHWLIRRFANKCDGVIVPTWSAEEYLRLVGVKVPTCVQPTGIEYQRFADRDETALKALREQHQLADRQVLVTAARLSLEKNLNFMLECIARLKHQHGAHFCLLIVGDGPQREALEEMRRTLDIEDCCQFVGAVPPEHMARYYQLADLFVFTSKSETQGMVILEAMAAACPVVAVRSSGIDDVVNDDQNGYKTREKAHEWTQRVATLLDDDQTRQRLSQQAQTFAEQYDIAPFANHVRDFYAQVLAERHKLALQALDEHDAKD